MKQNLTQKVRLDFLVLYKEETENLLKSITTELN